MTTQMDKLVSEAVQRHLHHPDEWPGYCVLVKNRPEYPVIVELADGKTEE
jgi:hypothetical protein